MLYWKVLCVVLMSCYCHGALEPRCSKFDFEERVLEKLVDLDHTVRTSLKEMNTKIATLEKEIETKLGKYETEMRSIRDITVKQTQEARISLQQSMDSLKRNVTEQNTAVAFVAKVVSNRRPSAGSTLIFTTPAINHGDGYNPSTGIFKAPVGGVYMFSVQLCLDDNDFINFEIRSSTTVYSITEHGSLSIDDTCDSVTTVAVLKSGEEVWVKCLVKKEDGGFVIESHEDPEIFWNMFSGALIRAM